MFVTFVFALAAVAGVGDDDVGDDSDDGVGDDSDG